MNRVSTKQLPYSEDAERAVLGSVLNDSQAIYSALSILDHTEFFSKRHAGIFKAMSELSRKDTAIDVLSVADSLRKQGLLEEIGGIDFLTELEDVVPTAQAITHYSQTVKQKSSLRRLVKIGDQLCREAWEGEEEPDELIETAQSEIYGIALDLQNKNGGKQVIGPGEIAKLAAESAAEWLENPDKARGIETGFTRLDSIIRGLKDVNIISASTGIGKTAFALNIGVNIGINQKIPILYVNHEMNLEELTIRLQGILSGVPSQVILNGRYSERYSFGRVMKASELIQDGKLFLTDNRPKNINAVIALIQKYRAQHGIEVVIVDYLGEIAPDKLSELENSEYATYGRWVQQLKGVCTSLGVKLILLAQLNRDGADSPSRNKIGGSFKIVQKADVFLILGVDKKGRHFLKIDKNRNGPAPKEIDLDFDKDTQRICESA